MTNQFILLTECPSSSLDNKPHPLYILPSIIVWVRVDKHEGEPRTHIKVKDSPQREGRFFVVMESPEEVLAKMKNIADPFEEVLGEMKNIADSTPPVLKTKIKEAEDLYDLFKD